MGTDWETVPLNSPAIGESHDGGVGGDEKREYDTKSLIIENEMNSQRKRPIIGFRLCSCNAAILSMSSKLEQSRASVLLSLLFSQ
jgi:hypothetical protein